MIEQPELRFEPVEEFAALDEPGADPLASVPDGGVVIPVDGDVLVYGDGGAGKTTLVLDLCWALAAGGSWLDIVTASRPLTVTIIENEGSRPEFRRKLRAKLAATEADLDSRIAVLADPWAELSLADEQHRQALALALREQETDLLVVGPLVSAGEFPTGGTPAEIVKFEQHTRMLRGLLDRPLALIVIHHENKQGQVSGGWGRYGDTHLHLTAQGNGRTRINWAKAKWAPKLHKTDTQLLWADGETFTVEAKPEITEDTLTEQILAFVAAHPGINWSPVEKSISGVGNDRLRDLRDKLLHTRRLVNVATEDGEDVLLDAVRKRETARLYLTEAPEVETLRQAPGAALAQAPPPPSTDGPQKPAPYASSIEGVRGAGAAAGPDETEDAAA